MKTTILNPNPVSVILSDLQKGDMFRWSARGDSSREDVCILLSSGCGKAVIKNLTKGIIYLRDIAGRVEVDRLTLTSIEATL